MGILSRKRVLYLFALALVAFFIVVFWQVFLIGRDVRRAQSLKAELVLALNQKKYSDLKRINQEARIAVFRLSSDLRLIKFGYYLPFLRNELTVANKTIDKIIFLIDSADVATKIMDDAGVDPFAGKTELLSAESLVKIDHSLVLHHDEIKQLALTGTKLSSSSLQKSRIATVRNLQNTLEQYFNVAVQAENLIASKEDGLATLVGLRGEKKYLLLFENADELRPGGGSISTYGLVTLKDGQTSNLVIDHVQHLYDLYVIPNENNPDPIQQTMRHQKKMYIYDANWLGDPNEWLEKIYRSWNAQKPPVDGVIVMSTKILEDIVRQYEPIKLPNTKEEFWAKDIVASLDYYFDVKHGIYDYSKYQALLPLVAELLQDVRGSSLEQIKNVLADVKERFFSRDLFVYSKDTAVMDVLKNIGIDNKISVPDGDEFYALVANLGSGKADGRMKRSLLMHVYAQKQQALSVATITQDYSAGVDDFRAGGYYGYLRYFLPIGSKSVEFENFDTVEDENNLEAGRQVFSNYFSVGTGKTKDLTFVYNLSERVINQINEGRYSLTLRKQGGVEMPFEVKINIPDDWKKPRITATGGTFETDSQQKMVTWKGALTKDLQIEIKK